MHYRMQIWLGGEISHSDHISIQTRPQTTTVPWYTWPGLSGNYNTKLISPVCASQHSTHMTSHNTTETKKHCLVNTAAATAAINVLPDKLKEEPWICCKYSWRFNGTQIQIYVEPVHSRLWEKYIAYLNWDNTRRIASPVGVNQMRTCCSINLVVCYVRV